jgi:hypothetical protein
VAPVGPVAPVAPVAPEEPVGPVSPVGPAGPGGPEFPGVFDMNEPLISNNDIYLINIRIILTKDIYPKYILS